MSDDVRAHYEKYPYPLYPLVASVRRCDAYALNLEALWTKFYGALPPPEARRILIAGCGSFSPYPFSVANPRIPITALDLSGRNIRRARIHCVLHGRSNVGFVLGNLLDPEAVSGHFGLIDAYGVLHHLNDPEAGLKALAGKLAQGGIIRIMVYNRLTRRDEESIRRALRVLRIRDARKVKRLLAGAKPGSRLHRFAKNAHDALSLSGVADALLHPCVHTFSIDECLNLIAAAGLRPLLFAHTHAQKDINTEVKRLRLLESRGESSGNFTVYLGRKYDIPPQNRDASVVMLNPCLKKSIGRLQFGTLRVLPRLGHKNPTIGGSQRNFLRRFIKPVVWKSISPADQEMAEEYISALFLLRYTVFDKFNPR